MSEVNILKDSILKIRIRGHTPLNPYKANSRWVGPHGRAWAD